MEQWSELAERGVDVNPCNSPKHPAALAGFSDFLRTQLEYLPMSVRSYQFHQVATRGYGHIEGSVDALLQEVDEYEGEVR